MTDEESAQGSKGPVEVLRDAGTKAREGIETARRKGASAIAATRERGEAIVDDTREKTMRAAAETNRVFNDHPIAAVAAAVAAGAVIGIFLPRLYLTGKVGKVAGHAIKAVATSGTSRRVISGIRKAGKSAKAETAKAAAAAKDVAEETLKDATEA